MKKPGIKECEGECQGSVSGLATRFPLDQFAPTRSNPPTLPPRLSCTKVQVETGAVGATLRAWRLYRLVESDLVQVFMHCRGFLRVRMLAARPVAFVDFDTATHAAIALELMQTTKVGGRSGCVHVLIIMAPDVRCRAWTAGPASCQRGRTAGQTRSRCAHAGLTSLVLARLPPCLPQVNRTTIYLEGDQDEVQRLLGAGHRPQRLRSAWDWQGTGAASGAVVAACRSPSYSRWSP